MKTVKEMIQYLQELPQDSVVIMSKDAEGNGFSPWCGEHSEGKYEPCPAWAGEFHTQEDWEEEGEDFYECDGHKCVVLWPIS